MIVVVLTMLTLALGQDTDNVNVNSRLQVGGSCDMCPPTSICELGDGYVFCACPEGMTGENCTIIDPCMPSLDNCPRGKQCFGPCDPNFICEGETGEPHCRGCILGWTGDSCAEDMDECSELPDICMNGGTCENYDGYFLCACPPEYIGGNCECKKGEDCAQFITEDAFEVAEQPTTPFPLIDMLSQSTSVLTTASRSPSTADNNVTKQPDARTTQPRETTKRPELKTTQPAVEFMKPEKITIKPEEVTRRLELKTTQRASEDLPGNACIMPKYTIGVILACILLSVV